MKSRTATAVAAGLSYAAVDVAGAGFFGPLAGSGASSTLGAAPRGSRKAPATETSSSRWLGVAPGSRRGARKGVAQSLYEIRGGASGGLATVVLERCYDRSMHLSDTAVPIMKLALLSLHTYQIISLKQPCTAAATTGFLHGLVHSCCTAGSTTADQVLCICGCQGAVVLAFSGTALRLMPIPRIIPVPVVLV